MDDIYQYNFVSQGKITIPSMDDSEEMANTDVRIWKKNKQNTDDKSSLSLHLPVWGEIPAVQHYVVLATSLLKFQNFWHTKSLS